MNELSLETTARGEGNGVVLADERARAKTGDIERYAVASITFDSDYPGKEESWGEFLTLADVEALHAWTGALLAERYRQ